MNTCIYNSSKKKVVHNLPQGLVTGVYISFKSSLRNNIENY